MALPRCHQRSTLSTWDPGLDTSENALFPKKDRIVVRTDQKWTKRQNYRPQESTEIDLRPLRKQVTKCTLGFPILTPPFLLNSSLSANSSARSIRVFPSVGLMFRISLITFSAVSSLPWNLRKHRITQSHMEVLLMEQFTFIQRKYMFDTMLSFDQSDWHVLCIKFQYIFPIVISLSKVIDTISQNDSEIIRFHSVRSSLVMSLKGFTC